MKDEIKKEIEKHALSVYPNECCGLMVMREDRVRYVPCKNLADATDHFILDPLCYAAADRDGKIVGIVHSHPDVSPEPSQADLVACEASGLPWYIVSVPQMTWHYMMPEGYVAPLKGRMWCHGVLDCYSLIRDWYKQERNIDLPNFSRRDDWWHKGENLYVENFAKAGFVRFTDGLPRHGDVLLMQVLSNVPNHGAVFLEGNTILHHLHGRLSCEEVFGGYYRKHTTHILRHVSALREG